MHDIRLIFDHNSKRHILGTFEEIGNKFMKKVGAQATSLSNQPELEL